MTRNVVQRKLIINHDVWLDNYSKIISTLAMHVFFFKDYWPCWNFIYVNLDGYVEKWYFLQVRGFFDRQINKLKGDGAFITDKIGDEHDRLVEQIFESEDKNKDGVISHDEFSGQKHDEL